MRPEAIRLAEVFNIVEPYIEQAYGIPVVITDVPAPFTGDLDGASIFVDYDEDIESALFIVAHLFGHTVQWCTNDSSREIDRVTRANPNDENLALLHDYEFEACRYSLQMFHDAG